MFLLLVSYNEAEGCERQGGFQEDGRCCTRQPTIVLVPRFRGRSIQSFVREPTWRIDNVDVLAVLTWSKTPDFKNLPKILCSCGQLVQRSGSALATRLVDCTVLGL